MSWVKEVEKKIRSLEKDLDRQEKAINSQREVIRDIRQLLSENNQPSLTSANVSHYSERSYVQSSPLPSSRSSLSTQQSITEAPIRKRTSDVLSQALVPSAKKARESMEATPANNHSRVVEVTANKRQRALVETNAFITKNFFNGKESANSKAIAASMNRNIVKRATSSTSSSSNTTASKPLGMSQTVFNDVVGLKNNTARNISNSNNKQTNSSSTTSNGLQQLTKRDVAAAAAAQNELAKQKSASQLNSNVEAYFAMDGAEPAPMFATPRNNPQIYGGAATSRAEALSNGLQLRKMSAAIGATTATSSTAVTAIAAATSRGKSTLNSTKAPVMLTYPDPASGVGSNARPVAAMSLSTNKFDVSAMLHQMNGCQTVDDRVAAIQDVIAKTFFDKTRLKSLLLQGGRVLFYNWLTELSSEVQGIAPGKMSAQSIIVLRLVRDLVKVLDQAHWTADNIKEHRFDKILRVLYKLLFENPEATCQEVTTLLKDVWGKYRSLYKGIPLPSSSASASASSTAGSSTAAAAVAVTSSPLPVKREVKRSTPVSRPIPLSQAPTPAPTPASVASVAKSVVPSIQNARTVVDAATATALLRESLQRDEAVLKLKFAPKPSAAKLNNSSDQKAAELPRPVFTVPEAYKAQLLPTAPPPVAVTPASTSGAVASQTMHSTVSSVAIQPQAAATAAYNNPVFAPAAHSVNAAELVNTLQMRKAFPARLVSARDLCTRFTCLPFGAFLFFNNAAAQATPSDASIFLDSGGRELLFSWLEPLCGADANQPADVSAESVVQLIGAAVKLLDTVQWTDEQILKHRFDKILKKLYKKYKDIPISANLCAQLKDTWMKFKGAFVRLQGGAAAADGDE